MSPSLPLVSGQEAVRALQRAGFQPVGTRGSHLTWMSVEEFCRLLR